MSATQRRFSLFLPGLLLLPACNEPITATDFQNLKMDESRHSARPHLKYMSDNAMMHDMSLAEIHFVPHTAELSGTGAARLDRMALLLDVYGGTVNYETESKDDALTKKRLDNVREYLAMTGCNMDRVKLQVGLPGGRGMPADRAISIYEKGPVNPKQKDQQQQGSGMMPVMVGQSSSK